jgi:hypothetical protein
MFKIGRKVKQKTQGPRIEQTAESKTIRERMRNVDSVERFMSIVVANLQRFLTLSRNEIDSEQQLYELLKTHGEEWKKDDYELGVLLSKLSQVGMVVQNGKIKYNDQINAKLCDPMLNFIRSDVREARLTKKKYDKLHYIYQTAVEKVKEINQSSKVVLSKLQEAEAERDSLKEIFEKNGKSTSMYLLQTYETSKCNIITHLCDYLEAMMEYHSHAYRTLEKIMTDIKKYRELAKKKREELKKLEEANQIVKTQWVKGAANKNKLLNPRTVAVSSVRLSGTDRPGYELPSSILFDVVRVSRRPEKYNMCLNFDKRTLGIRNEKTGETFEVPIDNLLQVIKSHKHSKCIKFRWRGRETKFDPYSFQSATEREKFYEAFWFMKSGFTREVLLSRKPPTTRDIKIFCGSWNIGDAPPPYDTPLDCWIPKEQFDIVAVAFQECEYTPREGYISCEDDCFAWIGQHLGENYMKLAGASLWAIRIVVFVRRDLYYKITRLKTSTVATGLAKVIGNKGGAGVAFNLYDTRLCFVGAHLAARIDRRRMELRHQHYRDILRDLNFSDNGDIHHEFDHIFWMGDLNYRIELPRNEIIKLCEQKNWPALLKHDQLTKERLAENVFLDFEEGPINFLPTYRFNRGEKTWSEEKMREPAWCDRVLWKSIPKGRVRQLEYSGCYDIMTSDHRPVYATFVVTIDLPNFPHQREPCKILLSGLRGLDFKATKGCTDSYLMFQASWLEDNVTTPLASDRSVNPVWPDSEIPPLIPVATNKEFLQKKWIRVVARDKSDSSVMAQGVIYLENAFSNDPAPFSTRLIDKGRVYGRLEGHIHVHYAQGLTVVRPNSPVKTIPRVVFKLTTPPNTTQADIVDKQSPTNVNSNVIASNPTVNLSVNSNTSTTPNAKTTVSSKPFQRAVPRVMSGDLSSPPASWRVAPSTSPKDTRAEPLPVPQPTFTRALPSKSVSVGKNTSSTDSSSPPVPASPVSSSPNTTLEPNRVLSAIKEEEESHGSTTPLSNSLTNQTTSQPDWGSMIEILDFSNRLDVPAESEAEVAIQQSLSDLKALATEVLNSSSIEEVNEYLESDSDTTDSANNKEFDGEPTETLDYDSEDEEDIEKILRRHSKVNQLHESAPLSEVNVDSKRNITAGVNVASHSSPPAVTSSQQMTSTGTVSTQQNVSPVSTTSTQQTVSPVSTTSTQQTVSPVSTTSTQQNVSPVSTTSTQQNVSPVSTTSTQQTVSPVSTTSTQQTVSPVSTTSTQQTVSPVSTTSTQQNVSPVFTASKIPVQQNSYILSSPRNTSTISTCPQSNEPTLQTAAPGPSSIVSNASPPLSHATPPQSTPKNPLGPTQGVFVTTQTNPDGSTTTITKTSTTKTVTTTTVSGPVPAFVSKPSPNVPTTTTSSTTTATATNTEAPRSTPLVRKVESLPAIITTVPTPSVTVWKSTTPSIKYLNRSPSSNATKLSSQSSSVNDVKKQ